ncbi:MAG: tRNA (adenosine(37)-N6)-threonylcarbamoyltransferase complex dimerization subunit type 1 TsaB [Candidatus Obscuribacter sp.]|nr:tRNA (adenosine(37)-N6)-threonylcarbamoyltransferase complex dimerization subunit type 1 TsaB [Candidatus Obscuribacter sp.]MBK9203043.1 tRNA (adenosine(37)-N6)-threonylcarbamoyltransferase complex dimerization subunit type 1 TsaB [Candidatus Obscuribacter sp.]
MSQLILSFECSGRELTVALLRGAKGTGEIIASARIDFEFDGPLPVFAGINDGASAATPAIEDAALKTPVEAGSAALKRANNKKTPKKNAGKAKDRQGSVSFLIPLIDKLLKDCQIARRDLTAIAVGIGPGGFTGVRVAVVTARTLAQIFKLPLVGINCLEAACYSSVINTGATAATALVKVASTSHCYLAIYQPEPTALPGIVQLKALVPPAYLNYGEAFKLLVSPKFEHCHVAIESGVKEHFDQLVSNGQDVTELDSAAYLRFAQDIPVNNMAEIQAKLALVRLSLSESAAIYSYEQVEPLYLRGASVTLKKGDAVERVESH